MGALIQFPENRCVEETTEQLVLGILPVLQENDVDLQTEIFLQDLAVVTAAVGQVGDLVESKMKRLCAVKDSGSLFPGHGGLLDRADGHLLADPAFYYLTFWL